MAAINIATQIPTNINSIERLAAWIMLTNKAVYPDVTFNEFANTTDSVIQTGIAECGDKTTRLIMRAAFVLDTVYITATDPLWMAVKEISQAQIPAAYLRQ